MRGKKSGKGRGTKLRVLVTGANGFIGSHIIRYLAARGEYRVSGLIRRTSDLSRLASLEVDLITGSLTDPFAQTLRGFDAVVHTAARATDWGSREEFERANVQGTMNLLEGAVSAGVGRFVHFSSVAVYGFHGAKDLVESSPSRPFSNPYCTTKAIAEARVLEWRERIEVVVLRPANVFGPSDTGFTLPLLASIDKGLIGFPRGGRSVTSPCYIGNLVVAAVRALRTEKGLGEAYNVTDGNDLPWRDFLAMTAAELGKRPPWLPVPAIPLYILSGLLAKLFKLFRSPRPPLITPYRIAQAMRDYGFSIDKARNALGYEPRWTTREGMRESIKWYKSLSEGFGPS
jgi:nucleoside-diphosphate-sugar epimerase